MSELQKEYVFHPADLVEYAKDKPIGAARAALTMVLAHTDVSPDIVIGELSENMELNKGILKRVSDALRKNPKKVISDMPSAIQTLQLERDLGL